MTSFSPVVAPPPSASDAVDLIEVGRSVRRRWRAVLGGVLLGLATAAGVLLFAPRRFTASASLLLRSANDPTSSILSRAGLPADLAPAALGASIKSPIETELQILVSRDVLGAVVDSLGLQARVLGRDGLPSRALLVPSVYPGSFKRRTLAFERQADGRFRVTGDGVNALATPGVPTPIPVLGMVTIARGAALPSFRVKFEDREDAITRLGESIGVDKKGGEVAGLAYSGPDSLTAAMVPNAIVSTYLDRRRTVDRGVNARRYEFLRVQADSVARQLAVAEDALRRLQERSGVLDPQLTGRLGAEAARTLREQSGAIEVERHALGNLIAQVNAGTLSPRQLAAYPSFLKSDAINALLTQMSTLETERTRLLERRTDKDPEIVAIATSVENLEKQLAPLARAYAGSLDRQAEVLRRQLDSVQSRLAALPGQAEADLQGERGVKQLATTYAALQAQIVDARLAAIGEGGQVRRIDVAEPPKKPSFPRPAFTLAGGLLGGLVLGVIVAIVLGALDDRAWTATDIVRRSSLPAFPLLPDRPLLLGAGARAGTIVVLGVPPLPNGAAVDVARALATEAEVRGRAAALVDAQPASDPARLRALVADAEVSHPVVVVSGSLSDEGIAALLEAPRVVVLAAAPGVRQSALRATAETLARLGVPCLGVAFVERPNAVATATRPARAAVRALTVGAPELAPRVPVDGE